MTNADKLPEHPAERAGESIPPQSAETVKKTWSAELGNGDLALGEVVPPARAPRHELRSAHVATITATVDQRFVGEVPGGYRVDLKYLSTEAPIAVTASVPEPLRTLLNGGKLLSGNDWVTVSDTGVIDFDSRITIALSKAVQPDRVVTVPVSARLRGRASLRNATRQDGDPIFKDNLPSEEILARWQRGFEEKDYLPLMLAVGFEIPRKGFSAEETQIYDELRFGGLGETLLVGSGRAVFNGSQYGGISKLELDLFVTAGSNALLERALRDRRPQ